MATQAERLTALEERVDELSNLLKQTSQPFPVRNASARWLNQIKFAKPNQTCATPRCSNRVIQGEKGYYVPKGCGSGHDAGVYCVPCGEIMEGV